MTPLSTLIKNHIQLLASAELVDFLLSHLDEQAHLPAQLFCKQADTLLESNAIVLPELLPTHLLVLAVFYAYAPKVSTVKLVQLLNKSPQLLTDTPATVDVELIDMQQHIIRDYRRAQPLLTELKATDAELIALLAAATSNQLNALISLSDDEQLNELFKIMLINNVTDFVAIKQKAVALIRQPQLTNQLQRMLQAIDAKALVAHSLSFLFTAFSEHSDVVLQLKQLNNHLELYPYSLDWQVTYATCSFYQTQLHLLEADAANKHYLQLIFKLFDCMSQSQQLECIARFGTEFSLKLIDLFLLAAVDTQWTQQSRCVELMLLFCTELSSTDSFAQELIFMRLSKADHYLFSSPKLKQAAQTRLACDVNEPCTIEQWQQLLTCPDFVAQCTLGDFTNLSQRYAIFSLLQFHATAATPLITKKYQSLQAEMHGQIKALGEQLTAHCQASDVDVSIAAEALFILHEYYQLAYPQQCRDLLLAPIAFACQKLDENSLCNLLWRLPQGFMALALFEHLIGKSELCELLFHQNNKVQLEQFSQKQGLILCFARYLIKGNKNHWPVGLAYFAKQGYSQGTTQLLRQTLEYLNRTSMSNETASLEYRAMRACLLSTNTYAALIIEHFCQQKISAAVMHETDGELAAVSLYWSKDQLLDLLDELNKIPVWCNNPRYVLALHMLLAHYDTLFSADATWSQTSLEQLTFFICRHVARAREQDPDFCLGYRVIGELILRLAPLGHMGLFYVRNKYNPVMACLSLPKEAMPQSCYSVIEQHELATVPNSDILLTLYLLHYSGASQPVSALIKCYLTAMVEPRKNLHTLSHLMASIADSDLAVLIFAELKQKIVNHPQLLDETLLHHMARHYVAVTEAAGAAFCTAELALLHYFGRHKYYDLVLTSCRILSKTSCDPEVHKELSCFALEAHVEARLSLSHDRFYFPLLQWLQRLWYYGFAGISRLIPCDKPALAPAAYVIPADLTAICQPQEGVKPIDDFAQQRAQFIKLLTTIKRSPASSSLASKTGNNEHTMFASVSKTTAESLISQGQLYSTNLEGC